MFNFKTFGQKMSLIIDIKKLMNKKTISDTNKVVTELNKIHKKHKNIISQNFIDYMKEILTNKELSVKQKISNLQNILNETENKKEAKEMFNNIKK